MATLTFLFLCFGIFLSASQDQAPIPYQGRLHLGEKKIVEILDPLHRHPKAVRPAFVKWTMDYADQMTFPEFLIQFAEELHQEFPLLNNENYRLVWLSSEEAEAHKTVLTIDETDQKVIHAANMIFGEILDGKYIYVLRDNAFYFGLEAKYKFHHSSLLQGASIDCAGEMLFENGSLKEINLSSGHYRPKLEHGFFCLNILEEMGADLSDLLFTYHDNEKNPYQVIIGEFQEYQEWKNAKEEGHLFTTEVIESTERNYYDSAPPLSVISVCSEEDYVKVFT